jgi:TolA-binding protein
MGQTQQQIIASRTELEGLRQRAEQQQQQPQNTGQSADEMYASAMAKFGEESYATARVIFQQIVQQHSSSDRAPDAQYYLAETFAQDEEWDNAYREFARIREQWPSSPRAAAGAFRAAVVAEELAKNRTKARELYNYVRNNFPGTDEARQAAQRITRLGRG